MAHTKTTHPTTSPQLRRLKKMARHYVHPQALLEAGKLALGGVSLAVVLVVLAQLAYPQTRALPQTRIGGKSYGYQSEQQIVADIIALHQQKMRITSGSQVLMYTPKDLGIKLSATKDAEQAVKYDWRERLIPFSFLFERREIPQYSFSVDEAKAKQFANSLKRYDKAPVDAAVRLEGDKVTVIQQQDGYSYNADQLVKDMKDLQLTRTMNVVLEPAVVQPAITNQIALETSATLQQRLQKPLTVQAAGKSITADAPLLASWVVMTADAQNKKLQVNYDKEKIKQWLAGFAQQVYIPGSPRTVTMVDGEVVSEVNAADGRALDIVATADAMVAAAVANQPTAEGKVQPVVRIAQTNRSYTRSSKGLQALITYWDQSNAGTWGVVVQDFSGNISASLNPNRQFTSASVYKIYIAYVVYTKVDNGEFGMGSPTNNGNTVSGCLDIMIVRSDNACARALGDMVGWNANNGMLHARGFTSTSIAQGAQLTTPQDAANYLVQLENGSLLSAANRNALLYKLGHNIYRYAIPAGSAGHSANKLGAAGVFNHDVAIVYHPKGKYVLAVFSQGSNHYRIRDLARQISNVMSQ